jgi:SAM-dependent methyltransferase
MKKSIFDSIETAIPLCANLTEQEGGIWVSESSKDVSYPAEAHDSNFAAEASSFWFQHRRRCILAMMNHFPPAGAVFDIGGGNGYLTKAMREAGFPAILVEPGAEGVYNAHSSGLGPIIQGNFIEIPWNTGSMPAAAIFDVLEHVEDDMAFLARLRTTLSPRGRLYLTVPAHSYLWSAEDEAAGHFRRYSLPEIVNRLERSGFDIEYKSYLFSFLSPFVFLLRSLPSAVGLRGTKSRKHYQREIGIGEENLPFVLRSLLARELKTIENSDSIWTGTSCLVTAQSRS